MENISFIVHELINKKNWQRSIFEAKSVIIYNKMNDSFINGNSKAYKFIDSCLYIWIKSSSVANEINLRSYEIINKINHQLNYKLVSKFRFQMSDINFESFLKKTKVKKTYEISKKEIENIKKEEEKINSLLFQITDFKIKQSLKRLFMNVLEQEQINFISKKD